MKGFKKLFAVMSISIACLGLSATASAEKIKLGTEGAYAPFNSIGPDGKLMGFDIEIGNALCEAMEADCEWVTSDWDGIIPALLAKKFDAIIASMSITDERKEKIGFTSKYYTSPVKFAQPKGKSFEITAEALKGKLIGVQSSTVTENFVRGAFPDAEIKAYKTQDEANLDFLAGRVDLLAADSFVLYEFLESEKGAKSEAVGPDFDDVKYLGEGIGIGVRKADDELREKLNAAIQKIREDGTYKKINDKYFKFDVYGS
jgi:lysine-arginine-ornithine-binding protein